MLGLIAICSLGILAPNLSADPQGEPADSPQRQAPQVFSPEEWVSGLAWAKLQVINVRNLLDAKTNKTVDWIQIIGRNRDNRDLTWIRVEDLKADMKPAHRIDARQMVIMVGSFPYKRQLAEFQRKLGYATVNEMLQDGVPWPPFKSFDAQRRIVRTVRQGASATDFASVDLIETMRHMLVLSERRIELDDDSYAPLMFPGLVMPRPVQFERKTLEGKTLPAYPQVEKQLTLLQKTLQDMREQAKKGKVTFPTPDEKQAEFYIPEYCLLRFVDANVKPGDTYQYRIRFTFANPNYLQKNVAKPELAKDEEFSSEWFVIPRLVTIPPTVQYYLVTREPNSDQPEATTPERDRDQVCLQIHRWIDSFIPGSALNDPVARLDVGDWVIAERVLVYRGELAIRTLILEVLPVWDRKAERFVPAANPRNKSATRVPVTFGPEQGEVIVLDLDGREVTYKRPNGVAISVKNAPEHALLLDASGHMVVRHKENDELDQERQERRQQWRDNLSRVKH